MMCLQHKMKPCQLFSVPKTETESEKKLEDTCMQCPYMSSIQKLNFTAFLKIRSLSGSTLVIHTKCLT
jgi:hypothetical protein